MSFTLPAAPLARLQALISALVLVVTPLVHRKIIWRAAPDALIHIEYQSIAIYLMDRVLLAGLALWLLRLLVSAPIRADFQHTLEAVFSHGGGRNWLLLIGWMALSTRWADEPHLARYRTLQIGVCLIWAIMVAQQTYRGRATLMLAALSLAAAGHSVLAIAQLLHSGPLGLYALGEHRWEIPWGVYRGNGLTNHPNNLGGYLMVALFACALWGWQRHQRTQSIRWPVGLGAIMLIGLAATMSRSALLALTITGSSVIFAALSPRLGRRRTARWLATGLIIAAVVGLMFIWVTGAQFRLSLHRNFHAENTWTIFQDQPLLGAGAGNLMTTINSNITDDYVLPAHSVPLIMLAELGVPGLLLLLIACLTALRGPRSLELTLWRGCLLAILIVMAFDFYWWLDHRAQMLFFWALGVGWGLAAAERASPSMSPITAGNHGGGCAPSPTDH